MTKHKPSIIITLLYLLMICPTVKAQQKKHPPAKEEIIYHLFQRSFYDSSGDQHGDLNGIRQKLDYLQQLGVTAILLTPLYESVFYHNYFASDFKKIDPGYGTMQDYLLLIKNMHQRGMKLYMDMETQYVTEDHIWWKNGVNNLPSKYSDYIIYDDTAHTKPTSIVYGLKGLLGYDSIYRKITTVNLNSPKVLDYNYRLFKFWMDPNNDGKFDDGVDGFRLDHMFDNLDNKGIMPHLFDTFWNPLLGKLRKVNPQINIVAEQGWSSFGIDYLTRGGVDRVFDFRLAFAIRSFNKKELIAAADSTYLLTPANKQQVVFLENHDMPRFSNGVNGDIPKLKIGAALNLLLGGIPSIYYGQELGMTGTSGKFGATDANEIPNRQAFEWYKSDQGKGMAYWYKLKGPWKNQFNNDKPNDGISLEEQKNDPNSLWNFYRTMIGLRRSNPVLIKGTYKTLTNNNDQVFSFERATGHKKVIVAINLSNKSQDATIEPPADVANLKSLYSSAKSEVRSNGINVNLPAYGVAVWNAE
ncbi:MAG: Alpha-amylase precursor [Mucilaginibacter sp.]|nr:Alpha-amylase precursor [Mucilaginibacter sp.]